jgi:transcriptional regulator with XRE-family HTH domain
MRSTVARRILEETPEETKIFVRKYAAIIARVHEILHERGMTQRELADRMGKNPSELSRWLHGEHNLTLRSLAKLEAELGEDIISVRCKTPALAELPRQTMKSKALALSSIANIAWQQLGATISQPKPAKTSIA